MSERISWTLGVEISGGPKQSASGAIRVDAYDKLLFDIKADADAQSAQIQPADTGVRLLLVTSTVYDAKLTYSINAEQADETKRNKLDAPLLLIEAGAISFLSTPKALFFYNKTDPKRDAVVSILVGRMALEAP